MDIKKIVQACKDYEGGEIMDIKKVGQVCKDYRINVLNLSLTNFAKLNNENLQNIHAFEQGRANNIKYLYMYMKQSNIYQLEVFINKIFFDMIKK